MDVSALPRGQYAFPGPVRDRLVAAILNGRKTATSSLVVDYERGREQIPAVGDREAVVDSAGRPVCVTQVVDVQVSALRDVSEEHARAEGEDFATVDAWRAAHERFWHSDPFRASIEDEGFRVDDSTQVVCVRFTVVARLDHGPEASI